VGGGDNFDMWKPELGSSSYNLGPHIPVIACKERCARFARFLCL
jgi:hypothetical protein